MPRNASGIYTLPDPPVIAGTTINSADENTTRNDMAAELTNSLDRNGRGQMVGQFKAADGLIGAPGISFGADTDNGLYRIGPNDWGLVAGGTLVAELTANTLTIPGTATLAITGTFSSTGALTVGDFRTATISPAQLIADTENWAPAGLASAGMIRLSTDAARTLGGLTGGSAGRIVILHNIGAQILNIADEGAGSVATNRFAFFNNSTQTLSPDMAIAFQYDGTTQRWRMLGQSATNISQSILRAPNAGQIRTIIGSDVWCGTSGGAANAQTLTPNGGFTPTAYNSGDSYTFKAGFTNGAAMTLQVAALGAIAVQNRGAALGGGEVITGQWYRATYDSTTPSFQLERVYYIGGDYRAKGDILFGTGNGTWIKLAVGADGQVLVADSSQASGARWADMPADGEVNLASAATPNLFTTTTRVVNITGTTDITAFNHGTLGRWRLVRFASTGLRLVNSANLVNPIPFDIQVQAGDTCIVEDLTTSSKILQYTRASGEVLQGGRIPLGLLTFHVLNAAASSTVWPHPGFGGMTSAGQEYYASVIMPYAGTASQLRIKASAALAGGNAVFTVRKSGVDTAVTCTLAAASGTTASDLANSFDFEEGDKIGIKLVTGAIGATTDFGISLVVCKRGNALVGIGHHFCHNSGPNCIVNGVGVSMGKTYAMGTETFGQIRVPPCRIGMHAMYFCTPGTIGNTSPMGAHVRRNAEYPNGATGAARAFMHIFSRDLVGDGQLSNPGARGPLINFYEGDLYSHRGMINTSDYVLSEHGHEALGQSDYEYGHVLTEHGATNQAQGTIVFLGTHAGDGVGNVGAFQSATESDCQIPMPACTIRNMRSHTTATVPAGQTVTLTVRKNGVDQALTCQHTNAAGRNAQDLANSVTFAADDLLSIKSVTSATTGNMSPIVTIEVNHL